MEFLQLKKALMDVERSINVKRYQILFNKKEKKQKLLKLQIDQLR